MGIGTGLNSEAGIQACIEAALERETGIEPVSLAWKAKVLPLNYSRLTSRCRPLHRRDGPAANSVLSPWWRRLDSNQRRRKPTDLQSAPFSHSGTPPRRTQDYSRFGLGSATARAAITSGLNESRPVSIRRPGGGKTRIRAAAQCSQPPTQLGVRGEMGLQKPLRLAEVAATHEGYRQAARRQR